MKILIIDCTIDLVSRGAPDLKRAVLEQTDGLGATVLVRRAPDSDLPTDPSSFDRIIISGSKTSAVVDEPWIAQLDDFLKRAITRKQAMLGVCYGHQSIVRVVQGRSSLRRAQLGEFGWTAIELQGQSLLTAGLPKQFHSFSAHFEEVGTLPSGFKNLASSSACAIQAYEMENHPIFGIQFHPERNAEDAEGSLSLVKHDGGHPAFLHPKESKKLYNAEIGGKIFRNFLTLGASS